MTTPTLRFPTCTGAVKIDTDFSIQTFNGGALLGTGFHDLVSGVTFSFRSVLGPHCCDVLVLVSEGTPMMQHALDFLLFPADAFLLLFSYFQPPN